MEEEFYMPIWIKALLGFALVMVEILFTFLVFRFIPIPKQSGYDGLGALLYVFSAMGISLILFVVGLLMDKKHPYTLFALCLGSFLVVLGLIRGIHL
jgi:hypothetical protein